MSQGNVIFHVRLEVLTFALLAAVGGCRTAPPEPAESTQPAVTETAGETAPDTAAAIESDRLGYILPTGAKYSVVDRVEQDAADGTRVRKDTVSELEVVTGGELGEAPLHFRTQVLSVRHRESDAAGAHRNFDSDLERPHTPWQRRQALAVGLQLDTHLPAQGTPTLTLDQHALDRHVARLHLDASSGRDAAGHAMDHAIDLDPSTSLARFGLNAAPVMWNLAGVTGGRTTYEATLDLAPDPSIERGHCTLTAERSTKTGAPLLARTHCVATRVDGTATELKHTREWTAA